MADNVTFTDPAYLAAADEITYSGDTAQVQIARIVHVTGAEASKTLQEVFGASTPAVSAYGLTVRKPVISTAHLISAGSVNATSVKAAAGTLKSVHVYNNADTPRYVKFHNTAGAPTAGAGVVLTVGVQAGLHRDFVLPDGGRAFTTGIAFTTVTGIADADNAAVTASDLSIEVVYE
jgi:hypothetical protein